MVAIGSASIPYHISAKTKNADLAAAYLDFITGPTAGQALVDTQQVPAATDGTATPSDPLGQDVKDGLGQARQGRRPDAVPRLVVADDARDDGPDASRRCWPAGSRPQDVAKRTQADWENYHVGARREANGWRLQPPRRAGAPRARRRRRRTTASARPRAPGEPRRVAYLYLAPAFLFYLLFAFGPLHLHGVVVVLRLGRPDGRHVDRARQLQEGVPGPGDPRVVRPLVRADLLLRDPAGRRSG